MKDDNTTDDMHAFGFVPHRGMTKFVRDELTRNERVCRNNHDNQMTQKNHAPKTNFPFQY